MEIRKKTYRHTIYDTTLTKHVKDSVLACFFMHTTGYENFLK